MLISDQVLVILAIVCFVIAAYPPSKIQIRFEWLGAPLFVATWL